jgi:hypothetical protein
MLLAIYFIPSIVASVRHHRNKLAITVLNVFGGWTVIGWVVALVWARRLTWTPELQAQGIDAPTMGKMMKPPINADAIVAELPPKRRAKVLERGRQLIAEEKRRRRARRGIPKNETKSKRTSMQINQ